jgi:hypothetical protein
MSDEYERMKTATRRLLSEALREQAERLIAEFAAGVDAERAEEIDIWFKFHKKSLARSREARTRLN